MSSLHEWASRNAASSAAKGVDAASRWVVAGGKPAPPPTSSSGSGGYATVYCTGHSDGGVRLWAMHGEAPQLLGLAPSSAAAKALQGQRVSPVSTLEFAWEQGLLVSGHEGGEVSAAGYKATALRLALSVFICLAACTGCCLPGLPGRSSGSWCKERAAVFAAGPILLLLAGARLPVQRDCQAHGLRHL
jgi:hypothetical protein